MKRVEHEEIDNIEKNTSIYNTMEVTMKKAVFTFKKDAKPQGSSYGFWHDLTTGRYIRPEEVLEYEDELRQVLEAVDLLKCFKQSMEEAGLIEEF